VTRALLLVTHPTQTASTSLPFCVSDRNLGLTRGHLSYQVQLNYADTSYYSSPAAPHKLRSGAFFRIACGSQRCQNHGGSNVWNVSCRPQLRPWRQRSATRPSRCMSVRPMRRLPPKSCRRCPARITRWRFPWKKAPMTVAAGRVDISSHRGRPSRFGGCRSLGRSTPPRPLWGA
jgi:hypothetical protein